MDALKSFAGKGQGNVSGQTNTAPAAGQKDDYGDKAAEFLNKKYNNDKLNHNQLEKITDGAREGFEKITGQSGDHIRQVVQLHQQLALALFFARSCIISPERSSWSLYLGSRHLTHRLPNTRRASTTSAIDNSSVASRIINLPSDLPSTITTVLRYHLPRYLSPTRYSRDSSPFVDIVILRNVCDSSASYLESIV
ncbi:hypothetical protein F5Y12DRAFT_717297 [Xylaria sp. FL1777]|nr:hypothetical protein F5Y12DRAFT_717297 [Xylaria sp. FL1777]